jgi:hypothetical protein
VLFQQINYRVVVPLTTYFSLLEWAMVAFVFMPAFAKPDKRKQGNASFTDQHHEVVSLSLF